MVFQRKHEYDLKKIAELASTPQCLSILQIGKKLGIPAQTIHNRLTRSTDRYMIFLPKGCKDEQVFKLIRLLREQGNKEFEREKRKETKEFNESFTRDIFLGCKKNGR